MTKTKKQLQDELDKANRILNTISEYYNEEVYPCSNDGYGWGHALRDLGDKVDRLLQICQEASNYTCERDCDD